MRYPTAGSHSKAEYINAGDFNIPFETPHQVRFTFIYFIETNSKCTQNFVPQSRRAPSPQSDERIQSVDRVGRLHFQFVRHDLGHHRLDAQEQALQGAVDAIHGDI